MIRIRLFVNMFIMVVVLLFTPATEASEYTVITSPHYIYAPFLVAHANGYFTDEGLSVKIQPYVEQIDAWNAAVSERFEPKILVTAITTQIEFPWSVVMCMYGYGDSNYQVITKADISPQDFLTSNVGIPIDSFAFRWILWSYLKPYDINPAHITFVTLWHEDLLENFAWGRLPIVVLDERYARQAIEQGHGKVVSTSTPKQTLFAVTLSQKTYRTIPEKDVKKIFRAFIRAIAWIAQPENEESLFLLLQSQIPAKGLELAGLQTRKDFADTRQKFKIISGPGLYTYNNTTFVKETYDTIKQVRVDLGLPHNFEYTDFVDTSILLEVLKEMGLAHPEE